jgi:crotonobetainyl-CoA:carnitine CoA-transferase CaiB-like acyl-CoA transferase
VAIACRDDAEWAALHGLVGGPAPVGAEARLADRQARWEAVDAWLADWCRDRTKGQAFLDLQAAGVAAAPVLREGELLADPHMAARGAFPLLDHPIVGSRATPVLPWRSSRWQVRAERAGPLLGEDNRYVIREVLGYDAEAYQALVDADEIGTDYL